jgi:hypothetical protein
MRFLLPVLVSVCALTVCVQAQAPGDPSAQDLARRILALLAGGDDLKYSLIAWHFLQDPALGVSAAAAKWLVENCPEQKPAGFVVARGRVGERDRKSWRTDLEEFWGW